MTFKLLLDGSPVKHNLNPCQTSSPNYLSIFCYGSPSWCFTMLHNYYDLVRSTKYWGRSVISGIPESPPPKADTVLNILKCVLKIYRMKDKSKPVFCNKWLHPRIYDTLLGYRKNYRHCNIQFSPLAGFVSKYFDLSRSMTSRCHHRSNPVYLHIWKCPLGYVLQVVEMSCFYHKMHHRLPYLLNYIGYNSKNTIILTNLWRMFFVNLSANSELMSLKFCTGHVQVMF